jgi:hypothetical protein
MIPRIVTTSPVPEPAFGPAYLAPAKGGTQPVSAPLVDEATVTRAREGKLGSDLHRPAALRADAVAERALTRRAVAIGMLLVAFVAAFAPVNDYVLQNSLFIGNHFPIGIVTLMTVLMLAVNPAIQFFKRKPLGRGELIVIMTMLLVAAAVPSSGLMRYLEPMVVSPPWLVRDFPWLKPIAEMMPSWLSPAQDANAPVVTNFWLGIDPVQGGRVPVLAFLLPQLLWGVLIAAILGASFFLAAVLRKQWVHHERLTFPLATIPLELMAAPEKGKFYNSLWRNPVLWAGAAIPLLVYTLAGLHAQFPGVPGIALRYDFSEAFRDRPWDALPSHITQAQVYLAAIGICFFIPSEIAFSMWFFLVLNGFARVLFARTSIDPGQHEETRAMGTYLAYFVGLLWLARGHLRHVLVSAWKKAPRAEDEPMSYRAMVVGWGVCMAVAWVWLMAVGMTPVMAVLLLAVGTMLVTLMARIVAETGLFFVGPIFWPNQIFSTLLGAKLVSLKSFYWTQVTSRIFYADLRETLMPFAANSMRMGQEVEAKSRRRWVLWLGAALAVSVLVSGGVHHYLSYSRGRIAMGDNWASHTVPLGALQDTYKFKNSPPERDMATSWEQAGLGAAMATGLMVGRVLWAGWPLHPIGLVLMSSGPMQIMWFSIFIGWGTKRLLLRYGGAGAFRRARPFFIGLIVGETLAAGGWMLVGVLSGGAVRFAFLPGL